jgi:hypothetical protein
MKLCAGLLAQSHAWEQLFLQEGFPVEVIPPGEEPSGGGCSVVIINRALSPDDISALEQYLRSGGAVLGSASLMRGLGGTSTRKERIEYLVPQGEEILDGASLLDLGVVGEIPREANALRTQTGSYAVFAGELGGGLAVALPFDCEAAMLDTRALVKNFPAGRDRLPSERTSLVAKGEVRHLLHSALEFLHHQRGVPYVHLWPFPDGQENVFAFRVDTDAATRSEVESLLVAGLEYGIGMTWFLDVRSHESWLEHFAAMTGQEIGVHCYEHRVFEQYEDILRDVGRAREALRALGLNPQGYAAPYGHWSPALARAVDHLGFLYSSEFSLFYDSTPVCQPTRTGVSTTLQVPIHPICPGSLTRVAYAESEATAYFTLKVEEKLIRREPLLFYHHPGQRAWGTVRSLFSAIREKNIVPMTMGEFARWWMTRQSTRFAARADGKGIMLEFEGGTGDAETRRVRLRVSAPGGKEFLTPLTPKIDLATMQSRDVPRYRVPANIRRIRDFDPRSLLGDLYSRMVRRIR